ncbi:helix-turn-helix domain-containing protein [Bacteroides fragilis]|nr:helix-turn-helix domain-containing protein [Bacteroides fragilis]MCE8655233.1 helix-turn-helix domain-containing protein [Bacteroides fragilis]
MELITKEDCEELLADLQAVEDKFNFVISSYKPVLNGEYYLSGAELCEKLKITKRTLQEYRDNRTIPYIMLLGKTLYKESDIIALLEKNYVPRLEY